MARLALPRRSRGRRSDSTRQDVFYFGTPPGDRRYSDEGLPSGSTWADASCTASLAMRIAGSRSPTTPAARPSSDHRVPSAAASEPPAGASVPGSPFSQAGRRTASGDRGLSVRSDRRLPLRHRLASPRTQRLDRRWRIRPRVQDGAGGRAMAAAPCSDSQRPIRHSHWRGSRAAGVVTRNGRRSRGSKSEPRYVLGCT